MDLRRASARAVDPEYDVVVAGGGPAGSTAATVLSQLGRRIVLLEKTPHPRFHVGESLLPASMDLLGEIGFLPTLDAAGFTPKLGASFMLGDGRLQNTFYFREGLSPGARAAYQVTRSRFDHLLLKHCALQGAEIREGHTVKQVHFEPGRVGVSVQDPSGGTYRLAGRFFADATGRDTLLASRLKHKRMNPRLRKVAYFGYFEGARRGTGHDAGNTLSIVIRGGWIWFIPLEHGITSVGLVVDSEMVRGAATDSERFFLDTLAGVPAAAERLATARCVSPVRVTTDFSYSSTSLYGARHIVLGDAGFFLDPVFSSGVHLAILAGVDGAKAVDQWLKQGRGRTPLRAYQRRMRRQQAVYFKFIYGWYRPGFLELFLSPTRKLQMLEAITSVLGGMEHSWRVMLRTHLFFLLVAVNRILPLEPRISRSDLPPAGRGE